MASLVAEVLKKSGRFAKDDVHTALEKLSRKIEEVKGEVNGIVQKQYKEYVAVYADTTELLGRVKGLTGEMKQLSDRMENELLHQVREATSEQRELSTQLEKCEAILELLKLLCKISDDLQAIDADVQCGQCVQVAKRLAQTVSITQ
jgi:DNA repair exonuclease SbcCD ATPase subunit